MTDLRVRMIEEMKLRRFSPKTQQTYIAAVAGLAKYHNQTPDKIDKGQIKAYFLYLLEERKLSWSTCNVVTNGLKFFYTKVLEKEEIILSMPPLKKKNKLPEIFTESELDSLFSHAGNYKNRILLMTVYSGGLRVSEVVRLKVTDIDSERMRIRVKEGKGNKDRYTLLSERLLEELRLYWQRYRPVVWLFTGFHKERPLSIAAAQKIYLRAKRSAGIKKEGGIHVLRHCFATHLLESGADLRTIQVLMGHSSLSTTVRYAQVTAKKIDAIKSPLDQITIRIKAYAPPQEEARNNDYF